MMMTTVDYDDDDVFPRLLELCAQRQNGARPATSSSSCFGLAGGGGGGSGGRVDRHIHVIWTCRFLPSLLRARIINMNARSIYAQSWHSRETRWLPLLHFHFGECCVPVLVIPANEREKQKETFMAHHPSQFMILFFFSFFLSFPCRALQTLFSSDFFKKKIQLEDVRLLPLNTTKALRFHLSLAPYEKPGVAFAHPSWNGFIGDAGYFIFLRVRPVVCFAFAGDSLASCVSSPSVSQQRRRDKRKRNEQECWLVLFYRRTTQHDDNNKRLLVRPAGRPAARATTHFPKAEE